MEATDAFCVSLLNTNQLWKYDGTPKMAIYLKALDCVLEEKVGVMKIKCVDVHQPSRVLVAKHYKRLQNKTQTNIVTKADKKEEGHKKAEEANRK